MLSATQIDHINIDVKSFRETISFYNRVFGFNLLVNQQERNCVIIGNTHIKLCLYEIPDMEIGPGVNHIGFHIANFSEIEATLNDLNIPLINGGMKIWEKSRSLYIEDPNGYEIELSEVAGGGL